MAYSSHHGKSNGETCIVPELRKSKILAAFDSLCARSEIPWSPAAPGSIITLDDDGFTFEFRIIPSMVKKPQITSPGSQSPSTSPAAPATPGGQQHPKSDIDNADPAFHVADVNATHVLCFNRFPVYRPQYLVVTADCSRRQTSALDIQDFRAAWAALAALAALDAEAEASVDSSGVAGAGADVDMADTTDADDPANTTHFAFFNCGPLAGCSRMHKHMQILPQPRGGVLAERMSRGAVETGTIPYKHFFAVLPPSHGHGTAEEGALAVYLEHVRLCSAALHEGGQSLRGGGVGAPPPHNVLFTRRWIMTIPRRRAWIGEVSANAAGFMGLVWAPSLEVVEAWTRVGPKRALGELGVPSQD